MKFAKALSAARQEIAYIRAWMFCTTLMIYLCFATILVILHYTHEFGTTAPVSIAVSVGSFSSLLLLIVGAGGYWSSMRVSKALRTVEESVGDASTSFSH